MTIRETIRAEVKKRGRPSIRTKTRCLLVAAVALVVGASAFVAWLMRPVARINTMLADVGLPPIPVSRTQFSLQTGQRTYVRFSTDPNTIADYFVKASQARVTTIFYADAPIPPDEPLWFRPSVSKGTQMYILRPKNGEPTSVWLANLAINQKGQTIYIILWPKSKEPNRMISWLRKLFS